MNDFGDMLNASLSQNRQEQEIQFQNIRNEVQTHFKTIKQELSSELSKEFQNVREEMREEFKEEFVNIRKEFHSDLKGVQDEIGEMRKLFVQFMKSQAQPAPSFYHREEQQD